MPSYMSEIIRGKNSKADISVLGMQFFYRKKFRLKGNKIEWKRAKK
jgi:hypothetical protein